MDRGGVKPKGVTAAQPRPQPAAVNPLMPMSGNPFASAAPIPGDKNFIGPTVPNLAAQMAASNPGMSDAMLARQAAQDAGGARGTNVTPVNDIPQGTPSQSAQANIPALKPTPPAAQSQSATMSAPFDEVGAMEQMMNKAGWRTSFPQPDGSMSKLEHDGSGYFVTDEKGRKLMVQPTLPMNMDIWKMKNGATGLSPTNDPVNADPITGRKGRAADPEINRGMSELGRAITQRHPLQQERGEYFLDQNHARVSSGGNGDPFAVDKFGNTVATGKWGQSNVALLPGEPMAEGKGVTTGQGVVPGTVSREIVGKYGAGFTNNTTPNGLPVAPAKTPGWQRDITAKYPQVGVAGSPENKSYVDAFKKRGFEGPGAMSLADEMFGGKPATPATVAGTNAAVAGGASGAVAHTHTDALRTRANGPGNPAPAQSGVNSPLDAVVNPSVIGMGAFTAANKALTGAGQAVSSEIQKNADRAQQNQQNTEAAAARGAAASDEARQSRSRLWQQQNPNKPWELNPHQPRNPFL